MTAKVELLAGPEIREAWKKLAAAVENQHVMVNSEPDGDPKEWEEDILVAAHQVMQAARTWAGRTLKIRT